MRALDDKVNPQKRGLSESDETLWDEFNRDFVNSFTDNAMTQEAYNKLKTLHLSVLKRDVVPTTLQEWYDMSRREHAKWALIKASDLIGGQSGKQLFQKKWKQQWAHKGETKDPNAMDVDS